MSAGPVLASIANDQSTPSGVEISGRVSGVERTEDIYVGVFFDGYGQDGNVNAWKTNMFRLYELYESPFKTYKENKSWRPHANIKEAFDYIEALFCRTIVAIETGGSPGMIFKKCRHLYIDIFGYSWGAAEALELALKIRKEGFDCTWVDEYGTEWSAHYGEEKDVRIRFLGLISPVSAGINDVDSGPPIPRKWIVPANVKYYFGAFRNPRVHERNEQKQIAFSHEHRPEISGGVRDLTNRSKFDPDDPDTEYGIYQVNHSDAGGWQPDGREITRDIWSAFGLARELRGPTWRPVPINLVSEPGSGDGADAIFWSWEDAMKVKRWAMDFDLNHFPLGLFAPKGVKWPDKWWIGRLMWESAGDFWDAVK